MNPIPTPPKGENMADATAPDVTSINPRDGGDPPEPEKEKWGLPVEGEEEEAESE
jgi:hypothetical protein